MSTSVDPDSGETPPPNSTSPFPNPGETAQDYDAQAQGRVTLQYRKSPKFLATISILAAAIQALENCAVQIATLDDPAIATGVNLDVTGDLIGQSRVLSNGTVVSDAVYRLLIALRIAKNNSIGSSPEYLAYLTFVFHMYVGGSAPFRYYDSGGMAVGIEVGTGGPPSDDQLALLNDGPGSSSPSPRAMGVGVGRAWYDPADYFGFFEDTDAGAFGFAEIGGSPTLGGKFAEIF